MAQFIAAVRQGYEKVDILVNNAGITRDGLLVRMSPQDWEEVLRVDLTGAFYVTQAVAREMLHRRRGAIVNISSVAGLIGNAGQANYSAAKAGLLGFTRRRHRGSLVGRIEANQEAAPRREGLGPVAARPLLAP